MDTVPEDSDEIEEYLLQTVLHGIDLSPSEAGDIVSYTKDRHQDLHGPYDTYFVLGSYEPPFKYRLEIAQDLLNRRYDSYAYLLANQPDPGFGQKTSSSVFDRIPALKLKFYLHALHADYIVLVLEHNRGGALAEFGRCDFPTVIDRTYVLPRGRDDLHDGEIDSVDKAKARAIEVAYNDDSEQEIENIVENANDHGVHITKSDLKKHLEDELKDTDPSISGVIVDSLTHFEAMDQCLPWTTEEDLRDVIGDIP